MTTEQWQKVKEVYDEIAGHEAAQWSAHLNAICADKEVRGEVEHLLRLQVRVGEFLEQPLQLTLVQDQTGKQIGAYRLQREIGRGGMGTVYRAERTDDVHRKQVAIKLVWPGFDSAEIFNRFRQERHILAELDHPNIARLLDGGTTNEGWPYVVMEYVAGEPITHYCNQRKLSVTERLQLFQQVCAAASYAHRNLVVHRDLKPSNILVTRDGVAKLLDFGIAKILDPALRPEALSLTNTGLQAMTPEYASPEQTRGETITTATDVYSLGVMLYELLTGHQPYRFSRRTLHEVLRVIAEQEPLRPSQVSQSGSVPRAVASGLDTEIASPTVTASGTEPTSFNNAQENTPDKLRRRLEGDLDNIILKALRKEPEQRYSSVEQFSLDIGRHLTGEPVIARTPTVPYRVNKFVRRNKLGTAFVGFVALTLIAIVGLAIWQRRAALAQARETRRDVYAARISKAVLEREDFNLASIRETVEDFLPRTGEEDLRGFEWYYLWRWYNRDLLTLPQDRTIIGANVIKNSPLVVTNAQMDSYWMHYVWDTETRKLLCSLPQKRGPADPDLFFLSGGVAVQQTSKQSFRVWQLSTGKEVAPDINTLSPTVSSACSCANYLDYRTCQLFTAGEDGTIHGWDVATGALLCTFNTTTPITLQILSLKYHRLALYVGSNRLEFWDTATQRRVRAVDGLAPIPVADLEATPNSPSGGGLLCAGDGILKRFDWQTGREPHQIKMEKDFRQGLPTPGGKFFSFVGSNEVQITDLLTGRHLGELKGHTGWVRFADLNPQETVAVTASADHTIRFWDFQTHRQLAVIPAHERDVHQARFFRDGSRLLTVGADRTAKIWDVASLLAPDTLEGHTKDIFSVAFSPDSRTIASAGQDRTIKLWDVRTGKPLGTLIGHKHYIFNVAFSPSGNLLASASEDKTLRIWDVNTGQQVAELNDFPVRPRAVAFSPDGKLLAVGCDYLDFNGNTDGRSIRIWDVTTRREVMTIKGHRDDVVAIDFSPDGKRLASASWDNTARIWDVTSGRELLQFNGHKEHVWSVRFSPNGRRIATGSADQTIRIWDATTGKELQFPLKGHSRDIFSLAFSPDGKRLASGSADGTVKLWDAATSRELVTFKDHSSEVWSVAFSPDGHTLASGSWDKTVRLYRAATEQEVQTKLSKRNSAIK